MTIIDARWVLTEAGWRAAARLVVGDDGLIASIEDAPAEVDPIGELQPGASLRAAARPPPDLRADLVVPGMPDAHCLGFQYAVAGSVERADGRADPRRSWHDRVTASPALQDAAALERTATALYRRLRAAGYTSVAEFQSVHRLGLESGRRGSLSSTLEAAGALARAAEAAGIGLLLLPVLHRWGGFGRAPLGVREARFGLAREDYRRLLEALLAQAADPALRGALRVGVAPQSLRACDADDLRWLLELRAALAPDCPVHLPVSTERAEVAEAREHLGTTPIAWLCANAPVDANWTLVHATHATRGELAALRARDATVCLCPSTEANLGSGPFPIEDWFAAGGRLAIGSGSNVGVDPGAELRWLEYTARLRREARAVLVDPDCPHPGTALWRRAVAGGRRALGLPGAGIATAACAELLLLSTDGAPQPDEALDDFVFAGRATRIAATVTARGVQAAPG
jgi:formimidoylglutamate deiminase